MACGMNVCGKSVKSFAWALLLGGSVALLIWAKLRMVTTVPRTAYAEPETVQQPVQVSPDGVTPNPAGPVEGGRSGEDSAKPAQ
ncbi:MAG TPA: hypothetical protein VD997_18065 [Phycisphaerales bacterium]|nr:hypothetical protein [Phycisphaerales bacterium]